MLKPHPTVVSGRHVQVSVTANLVTKRLVFRAVITRARRPRVRFRLLQRGSQSSFIATVDRKSYDGQTRFFSCNQLFRSAFVSRMRPRLLELCALLQLPHAAAAPGGVRVMSLSRFNTGDHVCTHRLEESWRNGLREKTVGTEHMGSARNMTPEGASAMPVHGILMDKVSKALVLGSAPATARAYRPQKPNQVQIQERDIACVSG